MTDPSAGTDPAASRRAPSSKSGARETGVPRGDGDGREPPRRSLALGLVIAGKYRLERLLRRGGMGSVWVATHLGLQSPVAIKFMASRLGGDVPGAGDEGSRTRFEREASAAARLRMNNVVQVLDYGVDEGVPYIVMELLEGEDLAARLDRVGRMSLPEAASILTAVARALQRAHDMGLVHRDLKPENIFLAREGDEEVPKILDFGVAKAIQGGDQRADTSTSEGTVVGTPFYLSPEQAVGRTDIDHRSDLWSLGVIAYRMITGERPFKSALLLEVIVEICSAPIPRATSIAPDLPPEVDAFMERALAREPSQRWSSAKEIAAAFAELAGVAPGDRRTSVPVPPVRRSRVWIAIAALVVLGVLAAASWWMLRAPARPTQEPPGVTPTAGTAAAPPSAAPPSATPPSATPPSATPSAPATAESTAQPAGKDPPERREPRGGVPTRSTGRPEVKPTAPGTGREVGY